MANKVICEGRRCGWRGTEEEMLRAQHPFDEADAVYGCPQCKGVGSLLIACDEPDCWLPATCGAPTPTGYRQTCFRHMPTWQPEIVPDPEQKGGN